MVPAGVVTQVAPAGNTRSLLTRTLGGTETTGCLGVELGGQEVPPLA